MNKILSIVPLVMVMCSTFQVFAACQQDDEPLPDAMNFTGPHHGAQ
ncbi:hypothetical protein AwEntero_26010 [Enterobacterales bacterium]|nr:hypothetical protein AwEntero_26010 [Enterobacterales bacterium]